MSNVSITKEFSWDMAHMLAGHEGLCKNLHGHTYKMQVEVCRNSGGVIEGLECSNGMVIDFKDLKNIVKTKIIDPLDHAFIYWTNSTDPLENEIANLLIKNGRKVFGVNFRPTAEEMALNFFNELDKYLSLSGIELKRIKIWETPESFAEVKRES